tara:strand:- start:793 stop:1338 length:546 start_codon:yes stop_codon:yes gene_type:complete
MNIESITVKKQSDLKFVDGLVLPGGESTTISILIDKFKLRDPIREFSESNPILGTCAGMILMANSANDHRVAPLGLVDIEVERNAYGRQIFSRTESIKFGFSNDLQISLPTTFIRAPKIVKINGDAKILGKYNGSPIAVLLKNHLCLSFHPELNQIDIFHRVLFDPNSEVYYKKINDYYAA